MARIKLLQQRGWVRRSAGDLRSVLEDLTPLVSCAAQANQLLVEVKALVDLSRFCLFVDRRQCLELAERALARSQARDDDVVKALVQGNRANLNLYLRGWRDEDADLCREAVKIIGDTGDPHIAVRCYGIKSVLEYMTSHYRECCVAAAEQCQKLAQASGDVYLFVLFRVLGAVSLLHLGAWRELRQSLAAA